MIEKSNGGKDNPEKSSTTKAGEHISSGFSMSKIHEKEGNHGVYKGKDCMRSFLSY